MAIYKFDNPSLPDNEQRAVWVRVPLSLIRDTNPANKDIILNLGGRGLHNEELFTRQGEYGPEGDSLCIDGQPVKLSITLKIANSDYDAAVDPKLSAREKASIARARAILSAEEDKQNALAVAAQARNIRHVKLENEIRLADGTVLPAGLSVDSTLLAKVLTGMN